MSSTVPTQEKIDEEVKWLKKNKKRVRSHSIFGDDHHTAIEAQVVALEKWMSEGETWDKFEFAPDNVRDGALDAIMWRDGQLDVSPSENWASLVQK